ncbi:MAG TPA: c-type cytochrome domain-containing protein [Candidatus Acidoferrum sp.]|nr:c-type cytochrome domain-containing protein [Candidatus Acidoferrum sp.]
MHDLAQFFGHFHPMLVHLPIGGLVLLAALELSAIFLGYKGIAENRRAVVIFATVAALVAAACGWLLAGGGGYESKLLFRHRLFGLGVAAACLGTTALCVFNRLRAYRAALALTLILLIVAGHLGGELSHGSGFLTQYAPGPLRALLGAPAAPKAIQAAPAGGASLFAEVVQPILQERCVTCHGPEKQKAKLRMDSLEGVLRGGENGPVIVPGSAGRSLMIRRLLLPPEDEDHMPPDGKPQPTPAQIGVLELWINAGAPGGPGPTPPASGTAPAEP